MPDWKYGTVVRRAITINPPVYQLLMFIAPSHLSPDTHFRAVRLTKIGRDKKAQIGWTGSHLKADLFEEVPDE